MSGNTAVVKNITTKETPNASDEPDEFEDVCVAVECAVDVQMNGNESDADIDDDCKSNGKNRPQHCGQVNGKF